MIFYIEQTVDLLSLRKDYVLSSKVRKKSTHTHKKKKKRGKM